MQVQTALATVAQAGSFPPAAFGLRPAATRRMPACLQTVLTKGEGLFAEGDDAEFFFQVVSGAIRSCKLLSDGRRQIDAFHLRGDIFGLETGSEHRFSAEAVGDATVIAYRRSRLGALTQDDPDFRDKIMTATLHSLERAQAHMMLLGRKTAREKLATFLLDMSERISTDEEQFELPMQRCDIADHLGLTIETVSRTLTHFARNGLIRLSPASRSVALCNKTALRGLDA
jgi:CRP/FNR family nitrogen fixation transcriptional regulator